MNQNICIEFILEPYVLKTSVKWAWHSLVHGLEKQRDSSAEPEMALNSANRPN